MRTQIEQKRCYKPSFAGASRGVRIMRVRNCCLAVVALFAGVVGAQERMTEHTLRLGEKSAQMREPIVVEEFAWLAGHWVGEGLGGLAEEVWSPPRGGVVMGVFRLFQGDSVRFYEFITLEQDGRSVTMRLKHFNPDLTGWEDKDKHVSFAFVRKENGMFQFDGLTLHPEGDVLTVYLAIQRRDGVAREEIFRYRRTAAKRE